MQKFCVLVQELQAASLFASTDESRYILNGVHIEVRPWKRPVLIATDGRRLAVIESASPQEEGVELPKCELTLSADFLKPLCSFAKKESRLFPLSIEYHPEKRVVFQIGRVAVDAEEGAVVEGVYPKWRDVVPKGESTPTNQLGLNAEMVADFAKASKLLSKDLPGIRMNIFADEEGGPIEVRIDGCPNFYGVVMPLKPEPVREWQPEFLKL